MGERARFWRKALGLAFGVACAAIVVARGAEAGAEVKEGEGTPVLLGALEELNEQQGHREIVALAESTDGRFLAWGDRAGSISVCSFEEEKIRKVVDVANAELGSSRSAVDLAFDDRGCLWWLAGIPAELFRAQGVMGGTLQIMKVSRAGAIPPFHSVNLLPWGTVAALPKLKPWSLFGPCILQLTELETGAVHASEPLIPNGKGGSNELVMEVVRSPDGRYLVALADEDAQLLEIPSMKILKRFGTPYNRSAAFSPSSRLVALAEGKKRNIHVWDIGTGELVKEMSTYATPLSLGFGSGSHSMAFAGEGAIYPADYPLCRVDVRTGKITAFSDLNATVVLVSRSGARLYVGTFEGGVYVFELPEADRSKGPGASASQAPSQGAVQAATAKSGKPLTEQEKTERLIAALGALKGAVFIRNGSEHTVGEAVEHVRRKWSAQKDQIRTAQEFIDKAASESSMSGRAYLIRLSDGKEVKSGDWLRERLRKME